MGFLSNLFKRKNNQENKKTAEEVDKKLDEIFEKEFGVSPANMNTSNSTEPRKTSEVLDELFSSQEMKDYAVNTSLKFNEIMKEMNEKEQRKAVAQKSKSDSNKDSEERE